MELVQRKVENASEMSFPSFSARLPFQPPGEFHLNSNAQNSVLPPYRCVSTSEVTPDGESVVSHTRMSWPQHPGVWGGELRMKEGSLLAFGNSEWRQVKFSEVLATNHLSNWEMLLPLWASVSPPAEQGDIELDQRFSPLVVLPSYLRRL